LWQYIVLEMTCWWDVKLYWLTNSLVVYMPLNVLKEDTLHALLMLKIRCCDVVNSENALYTDFVHYVYSVVFNIMASVGGTEQIADIKRVYFFCGSQRAYCSLLISFWYAPLGDSNIQSGWFRATSIAWFRMRFLLISGFAVWYTRLSHCIVIWSVSVHVLHEVLLPVVPEQIWKWGGALTIFFW